MEYRIGEVAARVGMTPEGLRFYERVGLARPSRRSAAGYRLYSDEDVRLLGFIKAAQEMGFSLEEIKDLLALREGVAESCHAMRERLVAKLESVERRIELLGELHDGLLAGIRKCDRQIRAGRADECPVLEELGAQGLDS